MANKHGLTVPKISLRGRNRYEDIVDILERGAATQSSLKPSGAGGSVESRVGMELANRSYAVGVRALVYGSLGALALVSVGAVGLVKYLGIGSPADFQNLLIPWREDMRGRAEGARGRVLSLLATHFPNSSLRVSRSPESDGGPRHDRPKSELETRLRSMYNPKSVH